MIATVLPCTEVQSSNSSPYWFTAESSSIEGLTRTTTAAVLGDGFVAVVAVVVVVPLIRDGGRFVVLDLLILYRLVSVGVGEVSRCVSGSAVCV